MWLFLMFLGWPLLEIALFVVIGGKIGLWATLGWVLLTALLGVVVLQMVVRQQALSLRDIRDPATLAATALMRLFGGVLLILPGFFTDAVGVLLLLPPVQALVARAFSARIQVLWPQKTASDDVVDAEFTEVPPRPQGPSGWTRIE